MLYGSDTLKYLGYCGPTKQVLVYPLISWSTSEVEVEVHT